jgi:nucleoside phosphorylase
MSLVRKRWWVIPGESLWTGGDDGVRWTATLDGDDGNAWTIALARQGWDPLCGKPTGAFDGEGPFRVWWQHRATAPARTGVKTPLSAELGRQFEATLLDRTPVPLDAQGQRVVDVLAQHLSTDEWMSGRRLRKALGSNGDAKAAIEGAMPRYVRMLHGSDGDFYSLTLPGLLASGEEAAAVALVERVLNLLREKFDEDPDFPVYTSEDLGVTDKKVAMFARSVIRIARLFDDEQGSGTNQIWGTPKDVEDLFRCRSFSDFMALVRRATEQHGEDRPWPTAPSRLSSELPVLLPSGEVVAQDSSRRRAAAVVPAPVDSDLSPPNRSVGSVAPKQATGDSAMLESAVRQDASRQAQPVDLAIIIALAEEFEQLVDLLPAPPTPVRDEELGGYDYRFVFRGAVAEHICVARFIGDMGPTKAQAITSQVLSKWKPAAAVMLGIAASLDSDDAKLGDVVVAQQVDAYAENLKAKPNSDGSFRLQHGGRVYSGDWGFVQECTHLKHAHRAAFEDWQGECTRDLAHLVEAAILEPLQTSGFMRTKPFLLPVHLASGPVVGATQAYSDWLHERDRSLKALEMEAAGFMAASQDRLAKTPTLVVRGISDFGDEQKKKLDTIGTGSVRKYAMRNAVRFLWLLVDLGLIPHRKGSENVVCRDDAKESRREVPDEQGVAANKSADRNPLAIPDSIELLQAFSRDLKEWFKLSSEREFENTLYGSAGVERKLSDHEDGLRKRLNRDLPAVIQAVRDAGMLPSSPGPFGAIFNGMHDLASDLIEQATGVFERKLNARPTEVTRVVNSSAGPVPLVCIGPEILAEGQRIAANGNRWTLRIDRFLIGNSSALCRFGKDIESVPVHQRFVLLADGEETDARPLAELAWRKELSGIEIEAQVGPPVPPGTVKGLKGTNLRHRPVEGVQYAAVLLQTTLGTPWGHVLFSSGFGTLLGQWLRNPGLKIGLDQLIRLDMNRLACIPLWDDGKQEHPPLDFVKRVVSIKPKLDDATDDGVPVELSLEFAGGGPWSGTVLVATKPFDRDEHQAVLDELLAEAGRP